VVLLENGRLDNPTLGNVFKALGALGLHLEVAETDQPESEHGISLDDLLGS
jgi:hypothetical protein